MRSIGKTSGAMSELTKAAIAESLRRHHSVQSAWGFGSFFRGEDYHDIDVLVVVAAPQDRLLDTAREVRVALIEIEQMIGVPIDPLILTESEFESRPLRDMDELVRIAGTFAGLPLGLPKATAFSLHGRSTVSI